MKNPYDNVACGGMDVHYKFSNVTFRDAEGRVVRRERLDHPDRRHVQERLQRWPASVPMALEASFGWGWISDLMVEAGLKVHLANCFKLEQMRKARGWVKTNQKDADILSLLPLEKTDWWQVWRAPQEVRSRREQMRFRSDLVAGQTAAKNRIHAIFHRHGIFHPFSDLFGVQGRAFLARLILQKPEELPLEAWRALQGQVMLLDHCRGQLAGITRTLRRQLEQTPLTQRLKTIPGVGVVLAHVLVAEIGDIQRFRQQKTLASYALLAPRANDTGEADPSHTPIGRHLGHRGNRTLQWAMIEAAHSAVRAGGRWRTLFDKVTRGGTQNCNRGYIKVARTLIKVVYAVWKKETPYSDSPPRRPGAKAPRMRSGMGQFYHPMVPAVQP